MLLQRDFSKTQKEADGLIAKFKALSTSSKLIVGGMVAGGVGFAIALGFERANKEADKYYRIQKDIQNHGAKAAQLSQVSAWANKYDPRTATLSINDKMAVGQEAFALTRDAGRDNADETVKLAPILAMMEAADKARGTHTSVAQQQAFVKALEMSGGFNNGVNTEARADLLYRIMQSGGGTLKANVLASIMKNDPADMQKVSDGFMMRSEPLMQQMGGTFAVSLRTLENRLLAHVGLGEKPQLGKYRKLIDLGVLDKQGKVIDSGTLVTDPDRWAQKHMPEFYKRYGAKTDADRRQVDQLVGNTGGSKFLTGALREQKLMDASEIAIRRQHGISASATEVGGLQARQVAELRARESDLLLMIGETSLPIIVKGLTFLNAAFIKLNGWLQANPGKLAGLVKAILGLSAALMAAGAISVLIGAVMRVTGLIKGLWSVLTKLWTVGRIAFTVLRFVALAFVDLVGWPVALGVALVAAGVAIYVFRDKIVSVFAGLWHWVSEKLGKLGKFLGITDDSPSDNVRTAAQANAGRNGDVYMDGSKVGKVLDKHLGNAAASASQSNTFDSTFGQATAGMSY
ncbi:hypothetical protein [Paraburkholderia phosphatilytica]|uniref:hypothetical protein n=1 Tax=Paraburkholderia phosphatilytica TaxID=2282883 RepID=UPI000F5DCBBD|nr:hypothetical protein [Paraburkholderia phosphatilytica]